MATQSNLSDEMSTLNNQVATLIKVKPKFSVQAVPPVNSISEFSQAERKEYGIITSTGIYNAYRIAFALGKGASRKDETFDKHQGIHTCCGSKVAWRHRTACHLLRFDDED